MTKTEILLWNRLRKNKIKRVRFKAQHPVWKFVVDFYCHKALLVIEIDGDIHNDLIVSERDEGRELEISKLGLKVIRFTNEEVINDLDEVAIKISREVSLRMAIIGGVG